MECQELLKTIDELNEKYINIWEDVCNIESPTSHKTGIDKVGEYFVNIAKEWGMETEILQCDNAGNAVCITMTPCVKAEPVVFSGHIDTVHPLGLFGNPPVKKDNETIYGPGVTDCKGGVVASLMAMEALKICGFDKRPVKWIIQTDEETSSKNSNKKTVEFMCEKSKGAIAFLNAEPTDGNIAILIRKGILRYRFNIKGVAAHSACCNEGSSAIAEAAHKILQLEKFKDADGITCNCGVINGGTTPNTVAAECSFIVDIRFANSDQLKEIKSVVEKVANTNNVEGCSCILEEISFRPAMAFSERNRQLLNKMNEIYSENGLPQLREIVGAGGSDAAYITEAGIPCVDSIGIDGKNIHSADECARIDSLKESAKRLATVAYCI